MLNQNLGQTLQLGRAGCVLLQNAGGKSSLHLGLFAFEIETCYLSRYEWGKLDRRALKGIWAFQYFIQGKYGTHPCSLITFCSHLGFRRTGIRECVWGQTASISHFLQIFLIFSLTLWILQKSNWANHAFPQGSQTSLSFLFSASWWMNQAELLIFWELSSWGGECGISAHSGVTQPCVCLYAEGDLTSDRTFVSHTRTKAVLEFWRSPLHYLGQGCMLQLERSWKTRLNICLCVYFSIFYVIFEDVYLPLGVGPVHL